MNIVGSAGHRPWLPPSRPWVLKQTWSDLLFAHWPVPAEALRNVVPPELEIDERDGMGWVAIVPFKLSGLRLRALPQVPGLSAFPEINVRTYVTVGGRPGVYFFSLDADNLLGIQIARSWFKLNYYQARVAMSRCGEEVE